MITVSAIKYNFWLQEFYRIKRDIQSIRVGVNDSDQDDMLARNIQTSLATKVQDVSSSFRKQQSSYLQSICKLNLLLITHLTHFH